jgi:hypothetical protein
VHESGARYDLPASFAIEDVSNRANERRGVMENMNPITSKWAFKKGLQDLGNGCYAYLQPDGSWGWSNAGLIADSGESMIVDTLFDLHLTREMLATMKRAEPKATAKIGTLVNTH